MDVYDLLDFKRDGLSTALPNWKSLIKKRLSGWEFSKEYAENWGNHYAIPKPKMLEEKQKRRNGRLN